MVYWRWILTAILVNPDFKKSSLEMSADEGGGHWLKRTDSR